MLRSLVGSEMCIRDSFLDEEPTSQLVTETLKGLGFGDYEAYKACQAIKLSLIHI